MWVRTQRYELEAVTSLSLSATLVGTDFEAQAAANRIELRSRIKPRAGGQEVLCVFLVQNAAVQNNVLEWVHNPHIAEPRTGIADQRRAE